MPCAECNGYGGVHESHCSMTHRLLTRIATDAVEEKAYVVIDSATLMGGENYPKLQRVIELIAGGQSYAGIHKWLAMWPDIDTALREAERSMSSEFT